ncbi:hypothetical protein [Verrucomicrobium spinosum]|uniref:hypothetical protein n=1 Tax=Verrucomicrobium spinosum TaxID=2736 RepID=UPI0009467A39|nr:hypothetical protein [Verrucomicrobium spinosum]
MKFRALLSFLLAAFSSAKAAPDWTSDLREDMLELHYSGVATGISAVWEWRLNVPERESRCCGRLCPRQTTRESSNW